MKRYRVTIKNGKGCIWDCSGLTKDQYKMLKERNPKNKYFKYGNDIYRNIDKEYREQCKTTNDRFFVYLED